MTYNHPFWDAPSSADETAAWGLVQRDLRRRKCLRAKKLYVNSVAALFKDAGGRTESRAGAKATVMLWLQLMPAFRTMRPSFSTAWQFWGQSKEGTKGFERQTQAAKLFEKSTPTVRTSCVLHYLIHLYDDPVHASKGLKQRASTLKTAAAVPHALHMPSHIFTRLGYWDESAATNEKAGKPLNLM